MLRCDPYSCDPYSKAFKEKEISGGGIMKRTTAPD